VSGGEEKVIFEGEWSNGQLIDPEGKYTSHDQAEETKPAEQVEIKESTQIQAQPPAQEVVEESPKVEEVTPPPPQPDSPMTTVNKFMAFREKKQNDDAAALCYPDIVWTAKGDKFVGIEAVRKQWAEFDKNAPPFTWKEFTKQGNEVSRDGVLKKAFMTFNVCQKFVVEDGKLKTGFMGKKE